MMIRTIGRILSSLSVFVLAQGAFASATPAKARLAAPTVYDVTPLLEPQTTMIKLIAGKEVHFSAPIPAGGKVVFEDLKPGANWTHDANYKRIDASGQVLETIPARF